MKVHPRHTVSEAETGGATSEAAPTHYDAFLDLTGLNARFIEGAEGEELLKVQLPGCPLDPGRILTGYAAEAAVEAGLTEREFDEIAEEFCRALAVKAIAKVIAGRVKF